MANSHTSDPSPQRFRRGTAASERLRDVSFPTAVRGYDRRAVDEFVEELRGLVADLEAHQTREGVVQKALDELGEETAGILQRAHETADEIAARSRAQADGRLQRAEREAEIVKREADEYADQVVVDTRLLWEERQRLIEDIRHLADEVLGTADDAMERLKLPEPIAAAEQNDDTTTSEASVTPIPHPLSIARQPAPEPETDPGVPYDLEAPDETEAAEPWTQEAEEDPDATVAWSMEPGEDDPGAARPYAVEDEYSAEGEDDPDATRPYAVEDEYAEEDPDATAPWATEPGEDDAGQDGPAPQDAEDKADPGTIELEALPGGNTDEQTAEHERKPD
jgi:DivIVA domain-containing protein